MVLKSSELNCSSLYDRVKKLLVSYEWSDCSFSVSGKCFKAHKLILGISSPVFEAMFYGPLSSSTMIVITDIEPDIFQLLLNYIYTDKVEISSIEEAFELLYASRKYLIEQLTEMCITYIRENISIDNVISILNYPEFMQDKEFISSALKLFCEHADYLLQERNRFISLSCMKLILECNQMNIKEKDLIKFVTDWTESYCDLNNLQKSFENRRNILVDNNLLKLLRFCSLSVDELQDILADVSRLLTTEEIACIKDTISGQKLLDEKVSESSFMKSNASPRNRMKLKWHFCHRSPMRAMAPILIDSNHYSTHSRLRSNKSIFVTSLCIPTRMGPLLNFRNDAPKAYSEQISVTVVDESDNSVITFTNFMNTVEYDAVVDIEFPEPCFIKKGIWYKISFVWPQNRFVTSSYLVEYRDRIYEDHRVKLEFEDLSALPDNSGSFLSGLKYCL